MKKLLFIGALLVAGATSFGAVSGEFSGNTDGNISNGTATANLMLSSRGTVIDSTGKAILVVTPIVNSGTDGESLSFNFSSVVKDKIQTLEGKFTAEIWADNKQQPFGEAEVDIGLAVASGVTPPTDVGDSAIRGIKLYDSTAGETSGGKQIGTLGYQVSGIQTNNLTYTGTVTASVLATETGSFNDKSAQVTVQVSGFNYTKAPGK